MLAGPNGAGKTPLAPVLLKDLLGVMEFVNVDTLAGGLSAFSPERAAFAAGRIMLARLRQLARQGASFAFETTLASRSFASFLARLKRRGYKVHLFFVWLPSADQARERVAERVRLGGHDVPEATVRRRFVAGIRNFFALYQPLATTWRVYDNSWTEPRLVARGARRRATRVYDASLWNQIVRQA